jgi:lipopolysaccharide transport system ATP-binding protein
MSDTAIRVENLGKQYHIGGLQARYKTIREALTEAVQAPFRRLSSVVRGQSSVVSNEIIWALKDVSFEVERGEVVGIIGRNGAGKTTLLKILSRITEPTQGYAEIHGRVGSLLEVGTGFHHELTGRENVYLNGAILGMKRVEIGRKFDEIVAFAEVEKFIDTPVKHYSSGMGVRLAFAVAAHLEPEILLVDEVLAVGDIAFQKKCLGKMSDVAKEGRTVLFVSHNMAAVLNLCDTGILLENGSISYAGKAPDVVHQYLATLDQWADTPLRERVDRKGSGLVRVVACRISHEPSGDPVTDIMLGDEAYIVLTVKAPEPIRVFVGVEVKDAWGQLVFAFNSREGGYAPTVKQGESDIILHVPYLPFLEGKYTIDASIHSVYNLSFYDKIEKVSSFVMHPKDVYGSGRPFTSRHGVVYIDHRWVGCSDMTQV